MKYEWLASGDQDRELHKVCPLGPILLEYIEDGVDDHEQFTAVCIAKAWNENTMKYKSIHRKPHVDYNNAQIYLENWYAEHIMMPKLLMGTDDGN